MQIGRKDLLWNYAATFFQIGAGVILLPFILRAFPQETVAIWTIFLTIITLGAMLDFGFNPTFTRTVSYVVSGVKELKKTGYEIIENRKTETEIDYSLFKGLINAMKWFYKRVAIILFIFLTTLGTYYMYAVLKSYSGNHTEVYISWAILCIINSYSLYTLYYDSLMQGQGFIMRAKQIQVIAQAIYLFVAIILILLKFNLIAIVSAQTFSIVIRRILSYRTIYTAEFKRHFNNIIAQTRSNVIKSIYPNAIKLGITGLGAFLLNRSTVVIGSLYLSLNEIAAYGISIQITGIISAIATVYYATYQPKIAQLRIYDDKDSIKYLYLKGCFLLFSTFVVGGLGLILFGNWGLMIIKSQTPLLHTLPLVIILVTSLLETNHAYAGGILLTKNEVPFFKAAIISGSCVFIGLILVFKYTDFGLLGMLLVPLLINISYQSWKWPWEVIKQLKII